MYQHTFLTSSAFTMYLLSPNINDIQTAIQKQLQPKEHEVVLILMGEATGIDIQALIHVLKQSDYFFVGGIFPSVLSAETYSEKSVVLKKIPLATPPHLIRDIDQQVQLPEFEAELALSEENQLTALIWIDGLTSQISTFLSEMYNNLGNSVRYLGGGAGSLSLQQQPCIFTREGCFQDAAVVVFSPLESQLGVRHGWQRLEGPFPATETHENTITALNWRNAFDVYKEVVEADSQRAIATDNFFEIAKGYPFGIFKEGQEDIVRDPIVVNEDGELVCVGEVPENALLYILRGNKDSLIASARQAAAEATQGDASRLTDCLVVDCISRVLFLGEQFPEELTALKTQLAAVSQSTTVEGVLTLGEISSYGEGFLEFFNKTIVVGAFYQ
ncbi:MAG: FIST C-terminal domain-containing protein [Leptolyngbyaceae bacterium]|nr:FIST C-terminal domain-containing protein [Leptolyngbyaceae bacterium]